MQYCLKANKCRIPVTVEFSELMLLYTNSVIFISDEVVRDCFIF